MKVPDTVFSKVKDKLWLIADEIGWFSVGAPQKSVLYEQWIRTEDIGGVLSRYIDPHNIRVYIKDTIMKPYIRERIKDFHQVRRLLNLPNENIVIAEYIKPHGRMLSDGRVVCWGLSRDWKSILFATFERAYGASTGSPFAAVILFPTGKCQQPAYRKMVESAAEKLGIENLLWHDE